MSGKAEDLVLFEHDGPLPDGASDGPGAPGPLPGEPLAARMRPRTLDEFAGQEHILGPGRALRRAIEADTL